MSAMDVNPTQAATVIPRPASPAPASPSHHHSQMMPQNLAAPVSVTTAASSSNCAFRHRTAASTHPHIPIQQRMSHSLLQQQLQQLLHKQQQPQLQSAASMSALSHIPTYQQLVNINGMLYAVHFPAATHVVSAQQEELSAPHSSTSLQINTSSLSAKQAVDPSHNHQLVADPQPAHPPVVAAVANVEAAVEPEMALDRPNAAAQPEAGGPAANPQNHNVNALFLLAKLAVILFMFCQNVSMTRVITLHIAAAIFFAFQMGYICIPASWRTSAKDPSANGLGLVDGTLDAATISAPAFHQQLLDIASSFFVSLIPDYTNLVNEDEAFAAEVRPI
ncbi:hypothetical protein BSLG_007170 [Batrachochytrium salamandrivorans]|nr:hypothetical protein BASA81_009428 [Batrachochytrium salamandrivorans]KAJ1336386.1 hypothetical protein BSLG_007170 [Batrachochytrium salamandrivorans]